MARVGVFGAGYAGLVTGAGFAELGHEVTVCDVVPAKIEALEAGHVPFHEPGLEELLDRNRERLRYTLDAADATRGAQLIFVCVGTPATYAGDADLSAVWTVLDELGGVEPGAVLVMKSTVPVGTGETVRAALDARGLEHVGYVSNPEFLAEGTAVRDFLEPDRIVIGAFDEAEGDAVESLHAGLDAPIVRTDVASAEMIKLASNAFLGTRISFVNEIANVCELVGADVGQVALGMGLDRRIGEGYLRPGIGFGGSCLDGRETVLVRDADGTRLIRLDTLFAELVPEGGDPHVVEPIDLDVLAWRPGAEAPEFLPVTAVTRRPHLGEIVEIRTKLGRRLRCTPDHPLVVAQKGDLRPQVKQAHELTDADWLPVAQGAATSSDARSAMNMLVALDAAGVAEEQVIVRAAGGLAGLGINQVETAIAGLAHPRGRLRVYDVIRRGTLRLHEHDALELPLAGTTLGTARNGTYVPAAVPLDRTFWRVAGLYAAEGHCTVDGRRPRLCWSFHPTDQAELVEEVAQFWAGHGVKASVARRPTSMTVSVSSRLLAAWWTDVLGLGRNCYEQRVPDLLWNRSAEDKLAFLAGLWLGDGSWSYVKGGPSVVLELGTVSRELADGVLRLLGDLRVMARLKVGRTSKSTTDTYWVIVSGADQVERLLELVRPADVPKVQESIRRQKKRIAPTGCVKSDTGAAWVRVVETRRASHAGSVYSLEVPGPETFVTAGGLVVHNCFPKDISFLKLLAGNSGYHFQLLNAVIEVNELQKRRVVSKLRKHLGSLRGKTVTLLGLAFKPNTDDLREAPSIVLASRLLAEGADVRAWDPVVRPDERLKDVTVAETVVEAVTGADAAVIVTEWDALRGLASPEVREAMRNPLIIDGRNLLDPAAAHSAGFVYEGIGLPGNDRVTPPRNA